MNGRLCCAEILGVLLFISWSSCKTLASNQNSTNINSTITPIDNETNEQSARANSPLPSMETTSLSYQYATQSKPAQITTAASASTSTSTSSPKRFWHLMKTHPNMMIICAALILACTVLLISTLALTVKVCQLRRRTGSSSEYWMGVDKTSKAKSEPKENCFLLNENGQANQEIDDGAAKLEGGKAAEGTQNGEEKKQEGAKEGEEAAAPAAPEESSPPSKLEEETAISETTVSPPPPPPAEESAEPKKEP